MKGFALVLFIAVLLIVSEGKFVDTSTIDTSGVCQSVLRVKILGIGQDTDLSGARKKCETSCGVGYISFYKERCREICGLGQKYDPKQKCELCYPGTYSLVKDCRYLISLGLWECVRVCKSAKPIRIGSEIRVQGNSGKIAKFFPGKIWN